MSDRYYCPKASRPGPVRLVDEEAHHLARVRRRRVGESVVVFDGRGFATQARIVSIAKQEVELQPEGTPLPDPTAPISLTVAVAAPKGDRLDWLVEKATEIGVVELIPIIAARSVVDPRPAKLDRLRRAVVEASKQCGRNTLMTISEPRPWTDLLTSHSAILRGVAHPTGVVIRGLPLPPRGSSALLAIGPEGGFTDQEVDQARVSGWSILTLGPTILRVETAALVGCAQLLTHTP